MSKEFFDFTAQVAKRGYRWVEATRFGEPGRTPERFLTDAIPITGAHRKRGYRELKDNSGLFLTFAGLNPNKPDDLIAFANTYGPLGEDILIYDRRKGPGLEDVIVVGDTAEFWTQEITAMKTVVHLRQMLTNRDEHPIAKLIHWVGKKAVRYQSSQLTKTIASIHDNQELFQHFTPGEVILPAWYYVQQVINEHLATRLSPRLQREGYDATKTHPLWDLYFFPHNLIGALWLWFAQAVAGGREDKQCVNCGKPFIVSPDTARTNKRSCSNSCRTQVWRKRRKTKESSATPQDKETSSKN
jgi:hypothetical protein